MLEDQLEPGKSGSVAGGDTLSPGSDAMGAATGDAGALRFFGADRRCATFLLGALFFTAFFTPFLASFFATFLADFAFTLAFVFFLATLFFATTRLAFAAARFFAFLFFAMMYLSPPR